MAVRGLEVHLDIVADLIIRLVDAKPDNPAVLSITTEFQIALQEKADRERAELVRVRVDFQCLLGSLGLIPSDNEDEPCRLGR
jgi:hypothetical protein